MSDGMDEAKRIAEELTRREREVLLRPDGADNSALYELVDLGLMGKPLDLREPMSLTALGREVAAMLKASEQDAVALAGRE